MVNSQYYYIDQSVVDLNVLSLALLVVGFVDESVELVGTEIEAVGVPFDADALLGLDRLVHCLQVQLDAHAPVRGVAHR